ncbi:MAG: hypothetical protein IPI01_11720 [Ignavibacteriae bacterium]|nr:hypothetical protein [Ignavibacteriota bacterium]
MKIPSTLLLLALAGATMCAQPAKPFLSHLQATASSPLFTTYAAAMERSEFIVDEGYHFLFYDSTRGADFITDNAGNLSVGFRKGTKFVYDLRSMARRPVITSSYADMVTYAYAPFPDVDVHGTFLVHSSSAAVQDLAITNTGKAPIDIDVIPFLQSSARPFSDVTPLTGKNAVAFRHDELPDGWVLDHGVPYVDRVHDLMVFSSKPDRIASFRSYRWGSVEIPQEVDLARPARQVVRGAITHPTKERCTHRQVPVRMAVYLNGDRRQLLTENAARWGAADQNIRSYGSYAIEAGNFGTLAQGDRVTVVIGCGDTGEAGRVEVAIGDPATPGDQRVDLALAPSALPAPPVGVKRDIWGNGTELRLYWKAAAGMRYNVYRRDYRAGSVYRSVAYESAQSFYTDKNIADDKVYGYVVIAVDANGTMSLPSGEVNNIEGSDFLTDTKYPGQVRGDAKDLSRVIAAWKKLSIQPGATEHLRIVRAVHRPGQRRDSVLSAAEQLLTMDLAPFRVANEKLYAGIPALKDTDPDRAMLYWSAFSLMRQVMLPPEGKSGYNYYVFSREPQWGWGHGGQVFHESLTMLAYALMDPVSAMNSQRVFRERQDASGYINYRTGPYLDETIPYNGQLTSSAPWYAWQNYEVYRITKDRAFLKEMYASSARFYRYYVANRDADGDGLCEWGAHAVLECVRDGDVAVWDEVGWPSEFEGLDCNAMLVMEARSLAAMARELGNTGEAKAWEKDADTRAALINRTFWDPKSGFYFHVDRKDHDFTFKTADDLKREEIIGFLPLWAGIADSAQAALLVKKLTDSTKFWRAFGIPTLAADDPYYNPTGYWNGPVWVQWVYLIEHGLLRYGYKAEAREMVGRMAAAMIDRLKTDHNLWELYHPDKPWAGLHKTYIWAGIIARMMRDLDE